MFLSRYKASLSALAASAVVVAYSGCGKIWQTNSLADQLAGRGPVAIDAQNPFVASNMLLAKEMKTHPTVKGFIDYRGTPDAIEVRKSFFDPTRYYFFYLDKREAYLLEQVNDGWAIKGPERIPNGVMTALAETPQAGRNAPLGEAESATPAVVEKTLTAEETSKGSVQKLAKPAPAAKTAPKYDDSALASKALPPSVDIIHKVEFQGETLRIIAAWYTGDAQNANRIARINGIEDPNILSMGALIRIPKYLAKTSSPLTEQGILDHLQSVSKVAE